MWKTVKKQFWIQWRDWSWLTPMILGEWIFGLVLHYIMVRMDASITTYFPMGTTVAVIGAVISTGLMGVLQIGIYFNMEISMGCTRKEYFVSYYITSLVLEIFRMGMIILLNLAERRLQRLIYTNMESEVDFLPQILKWGFIVVIALCFLSGFCGTLLLRYGKKAFWVLWCVWMFGCLVLPRIPYIVEDAPNSFLGRIGKGAIELIRGTPDPMLMLLIGAVSIAGLGFSWLYLQKQQVTL